MSGVINPDAPVDEDDGGDEADAGAGDDEEVRYDLPSLSACAVVA